jgi:hypothetical protein
VASIGGVAELDLQSKLLRYGVQTKKIDQEREPILSNQKGVKILGAWATVFI